MTNMIDFEVFPTHAAVVEISYKYVVHQSSSTRGWRPWHTTWSLMYNMMHSIFTQDGQQFWFESATLRAKIWYLLTFDLSKTLLFNQDNHHWQKRRKNRSRLLQKLLLLLNMGVLCSLLMGEIKQCHKHLSCWTMEEFRRNSHQHSESAMQSDGFEDPIPNVATSPANLQHQSANGSCSKEQHNLPLEEDALSADSSTQSSTDIATPPDGGWGWFVVFGSFMIHIVGKGFE